jgi:2,5-diketo-D-gluconate reductase A
MFHFQMSISCSRWILLLLLFFLQSTNAEEVAGENEERQQCLDQEVIVLSNGVEMPKVGFGLAALHGDDTRYSIREHIKRGFRLMDGAESTEWYDDATAGDEIGKIKGLKREDVFIVTKIHPTRLTYDEGYKSVLEMLERWNRTSFIDLVLLHYPECGDWIPNCEGRTGGDWMGAWKAMEEHYTERRIRAIGVSNFNLAQLDELIDYAEIEPHVIQSWMDPFYQSRDLLDWAKEHNVAFTSYSSFGMQWEFNWVKKNLVFESNVLRAISEEVGSPVTSVVLAWLLSKNVAVIPRSRNPEHIAENAKFLQPGYASDLLTPDQIERIDNLDGVFNADNDEWCNEIAETGKCDENNHDGWCIASCQGVEW